MASHPASAHHHVVHPGASALVKVVALLLGITLAVVAFFALMMWADARSARVDANAAAGQAKAGAAAHADHNMALPLNSFAGVVPEQAQELAAAHKPYDATLPAAPAGNLVKVHMTLKDMTVEIAPGV
ncbi:MAG: hypothetical protein ICV74_04015, partial [Thermoleophilia bacterium]|nr:hypothetical protein [Thermoleophilia bacterium]